jgi:hypothetical protein
MMTRKEILERLAQGEIDVDRATELLSGTLGDGEPAAPLPPVPPLAPVPPAPPSAEQHGRRWLHIHVSDLESGRSRVRVNVPLGLVKFGMKLGARFTDEVDSDMMRDVMSLLEDNPISGTLVEVEDVADNERVHIYVD